MCGSATSSPASALSRWSGTAGFVVGTFAVVDRTERSPVPPCLQHQHG
jgi:hypothetical protein